MQMATICAFSRADCDRIRDFCAIIFTDQVMMKSHWIEHQGKRIFYADYSGLGSDTSALHQEVSEAVEMLSREPEKSVLVLVNFEATEASMANLAVMRKLVPRSNRAVIKRALLGVSGSRRFFITTFAAVTGGMPIVAFDTWDQAAEWLVNA
jgi:hypothetical protein